MGRIYDIVYNVPKIYAHLLNKSRVYYSGRIGIAISFRALGYS